MFGLFIHVAVLFLIQIALGNILKFRKKNWQFDFIGGIIYFVLVFSMFPQVSVSYVSCISLDSLVWMVVLLSANKKIKS